MTVQVCDALCGAGKTSAAIRMMNERTDERFIFVTQYVTETTRIKNSCLARNFQCPKCDEEMGQTKLSDVHRLMREGCNIATTHSLFSTYTEEMKELITQQQYILVLDEAIDVLTMTDIQRNDMDILIKSQSVREENGFIEWINTDYQDSEGGRFREEMMKAKSKNLLKYDDSYYFWSIPPELFRCFKEAYVLTYMFEAQEIWNDEEVESLLSKLTEAEEYERACFVALAAYSGRRKAELCRFKVSDFDDDKLVCGGALYKSDPIKTKGRGGGKYIPCYTLAKKFKPYLDAWLTYRAEQGIDSKWLFPCKGSPDEQLRTTTVDGWANSFSTLSGKDFYIHSLRHAYTTSLAKAGIPDSVIQSLVGWDSSDMVRLYDDTPKDEQIGAYFKDGDIAVKEGKSVSDL